MGLEYLDFPQGLDFKHIGWLFKRFHLRFSAVLACTSLFVKRSLYKNLSQPETTSAKEISSTQVGPSAVSSAGVASVKAWR